MRDMGLSGRLAAFRRPLINDAVQCRGEVHEVEWLTHELSGAECELRPCLCSHGRDFVLPSGAPDVRFEMDSVPNSGVPDCSTEIGLVATTHRFGAL